MKSPYQNVKQLKDTILERDALGLSPSSVLHDVEEVLEEYADPLERLAATMIVLATHIDILRERMP